MDENDVRQAVEEVLEEADDLVMASYRKWGAERVAEKLGVEVQDRDE